MTAYSSAMTGLVAALMMLAGTASSWAACNKAISVGEATAMSFGMVGVTSGSGRVTVSPTGMVTGSSGYFFAGAPSAGKFNVTGTNNCSVQISLTSGSLTGPGAPMTITNFTTNAGPNPTLTNGGRLTFAVGADLVVNAGQAGGSYSGTYTVTVTY